MCCREPALNLRLTQKYTGPITKKEAENISPMGEHGLPLPSNTDGCCGWSRKAILSLLCSLRLFKALQLPLWSLCPGCDVRDSKDARSHSCFNAITARPDEGSGHLGRECADDDGVG